MLRGAAVPVQRKGRATSHQETQENPQETPQENPKKGRNAEQRQHCEIVDRPFLLFFWVLILTTRGLQASLSWHEAMSVSPLFHWRKNEDECAPPLHHKQSQWPKHPSTQDLALLCLGIELISPFRPFPASPRKCKAPMSQWEFVGGHAAGRWGCVCGCTARSRGIKDIINLLEQHTSDEYNDDIFGVFHSSFTGCWSLMMHDVFSGFVCVCRLCLALLVFAPPLQPLQATTSHCKP